MQRDPAGRETSGRASRRCRSARHPQMLISRVAISTVLDTGSLSEWDFAVELGDWWVSSQWGRHTIRLSSIAQSDSAATTASAWAAMATELPRAKAGPSAGHGFVEERVRCRKVRSPLNDSANSDCLFEAFGHELGLATVAIRTLTSIRSISVTRDRVRFSIPIESTTVVDR